MRLQKYMADCGVASRRKCEDIIASGRVTVNGTTVTTMGYVVKSGDRICVDGKQTDISTTKHYYAFNKPPGVLSSSSDDRGRKTVLDYFKNVNERLFVVGRLDYDTEGLIFVTNDGEFANKVMHPRYESTKTYEARCKGILKKEDIECLEKGVVIDGKKTSRAYVKVIDKGNDCTLVRIRIHEGRNRQIRKMIDAVGSRVLSLKRIEIGPVKLEGINSGQFRKLNIREIEFFLNKKRNSGVSVE